MTEPTFQTLGRYTIRAEIGRGGFATVYQALDASLNREVALKVLHPQMSADRTFVERFRKEARTLASLRHPHIITVYEVSEVEGRLFIAMELAHGPSLAQAIADRKRFPWVDTLALLKPVSAALDYAHGQGVVHRDLKPANVLLDAERGPLLTDFGFARLLGDSSASMSLSGGILGTPAYIAPEVWELDTATPAADVYALGCIAYEMLTSDVLFVGKTPMQSMRAHDRGPQFPATWPADVPSGVAAALQVALARKPENRYPKATTFWHALNDLEANAQAAREQAERQAVADQWRAEATAAIAAGEWSAAKMAVGRWLSITPDDAEALAARKEIERQMQLEAERQQKEEAERAAQAALALATARKAEEEHARQEAERKAQEEADRKAKEEQERQRQAELAAQAVAAGKANQEAEERERQRLAREAARQAEEEARHKEMVQQKQIAAQPVQRTQAAVPAPKAKSNRTWLYVVGGVIILVVVAILFASTNPFAPKATPAPAVQPTKAPAVQPTEAPAAKPTEPTVAQDLRGEITLWNAYGTGTAEEMALKAAIAAMNKKYPDLKVSVLQIPFDQVYNKWDTEVAASGGPDMFAFPNDNTGNQIRAGLLADITELLKGKTGAFPASSFEGATIDGKVYGVPGIIKAVALYYNKSTVPNPPKDADELLALVKSGKKIAINQNNYHNFGWLTGAFGGTLMDADGKCVADQTPGMADALQYMKDLKAAGANFETDSDKADAAFRQGDVDMIINGPWMLGNYKEDLGDKLGVAPMPGGPGGAATPLAGVDYWYVNPNATPEQQKLAVGAALYLFGPEGAQIFADTASSPMVAMGVTAKDPLVTVFADAAATGFARPQSVEFSNWWGPFGEAVNNVMEGKSEPIAAVAEACAVMNKTSGK